MYSGRKCPSAVIAALIAMAQDSKQAGKLGDEGDESGSPNDGLVLR
jgi:hypothetical protein